jgi:hypothetical protein
VHHQRGAVIEADDQVLAAPFDGLDPPPRKKVLGPRRGLGPRPGV